MTFDKNNLTDDYIELIWYRCKNKMKPKDKSKRLSILTASKQIGIGEATLQRFLADPYGTSKNNTLKIHFWTQKD